MKKFSYLFAIVLIAILTSCNKDFTTEQERPDINMLHFDSYSEMKQELSVVLKMTTDEKIEWAAQKDFNSFGANADEFYESMDINQFKSEEELMSFVANSEYLEIVNGNDGEKSVLARESESRYFYFINEDRMFSVEDKVVKVFGNKTVITCIDNLDQLKRIQSVDEISDNPTYEVKNRETIELKSYPGCGFSDEDWGVDGDYRIWLEVWCEEDWSSWDNVKYTRTGWFAHAQKYVLGVWVDHLTNITYHIHLHTGYLRYVPVDGGIVVWTTYAYDSERTTSSAARASGEKEEVAAPFNLATNTYFQEIDCWAYTNRVSYDDRAEVGPCEE